MKHLVQGAKIAHGITPTEDIAAENGEGVLLRDGHVFFGVVHLDQGGADTIEVFVEVDDGTDGNWEAITETCPLWINNDLDADDVLVRQNNAVDYETTADANPKLVVFQVDDSKLGENGTSGDPNVAVRIRLDGNAGDSGSAMYYLIPTRYTGATTPEVRL